MNDSNYDGIINSLFFVKTPEKNTGTIRDQVYAAATDGMPVDLLIKRCAQRKIGTEKQIRAAIYAGSKSVNSRFKLVTREEITKINKERKK